MARKDKIVNEPYAPDVEALDEVQEENFADPDYAEAGYIENVDGTAVIPSGFANPTPVTGETPVEDLVHDASGNVREAFLAEGVGQVTTADALNVIEQARLAGKFRVVERDAAGETVYDVYSAANTPLLFGASLETVQVYIR